MQDFAAWSVSLGRWGGLGVRLHALFLFFGVGTFYLATLDADPDLLWICGLALIILLISVLLHELGHCGATLRVGGHVDEIVLGPLGGLTQGSIPREPQ